ncbi:MAG: PIN domain-containing protein [Candidatus Korobacteraceae bacterium]
MAEAPVTVLVDTSVWSLALRRARRHLSPEQNRQVFVLEEIIVEGRARLLGAVRQELLSGIKHAEQFARLQQQLRNFPDVPLTREDYETAAEISNACEAYGVVGSSIDMLLCAVALRRNWAIYTSDRDFQHYAKYTPIVLLS